MSSMDNFLRSTGKSSGNAMRSSKKPTLRNVPEDPSYNMKRYEAEELYHPGNTGSGNDAVKRQCELVTQKCFSKLGEAGLRSQDYRGSKYPYPRELQFPPPKRSVTPPKADGEHRLPRA